MTKFEVRWSYYDEGADELRHGRSDTIVSVTNLGACLAAGNLYREIVGSRLDWANHGIWVRDVWVVKITEKRVW